MARLTTYEVGAEEGWYDERRVGLGVLIEGKTGLV
jgi:hypothetical protein